MTRSFMTTTIGAVLCSIVLTSTAISGTAVNRNPAGTMAPKRDSIDLSCQRRPLSRFLIRRLLVRRGYSPINSVSFRRFYTRPCKQYYVAVVNKKCESSFYTLKIQAHTGRIFRKTRSTYVC